MKVQSILFTLLMRGNVNIDSLVEEVVIPYQKLIDRHDELGFDSLFITYGGNQRFAYLEVGSDRLSAFQIHTLSQLLNNVCDRLRFKKSPCEGAHVAIKNILKYETNVKYKIDERA